MGKLVGQASRNGRSGLVVEFTGVTGVGKSTLLAAVEEVLCRRGFVVAQAERAVRSRCDGISWRWRRLNEFVTDLLAMPPFLQYAVTPEGNRLARMAGRLIARHARGVAYTLRLARNFMKRVGVHRLLQGMECRRRFDFVLCDEGILHTVHNLFVHVGAAPEREEIERFAGMLPLPDAVVWVTAPPEQSTAVTLQRGHARVGSIPCEARDFVHQANQAFRVVGALPAIQDRLLAIDNGIVADSDSQSVIAARAEEIARFLEHQRTLLTDVT